MNRHQASMQEFQNNCEKMDEVRSFKGNTESIDNKIRRCSRDKPLVESTNNAIQNIHDAIDSLMKNINIIEDNESAWALKHNTTNELFKEKINFPPSIINNFRKLAKYRESNFGDRHIEDLRVIDFFRILNDADLRDTTLRIIDEEKREPSLKVVIKTIKKIHVKRLKNFRIQPKILERFCKSLYVKPTRTNPDLILTSDNIHDKFERKLACSSKAQKKPSYRGFDSIDP